VSFSNDVIFPTNISYGSSTYRGGRAVRIVDLPGDEKRIAYRNNSIRRFNVAYGIKSVADLDEIVKLWESHGQTRDGFLYKDYSDFKSCGPNATPANTDVTIGTGDGADTTFQLVKIYTQGSLSYSKTIWKPKTGTVKIALNGVNQTTGWTVNTATGIVTFTVPPTLGVTVSAGFEYYVPVRFDIEELEINLSHYERGQVPDIMLKELLRPDA
jgi:uncharacterized protein (TIGR02217 family)